MTDRDGTRARTLLIAGTASHVGKSTVAAGLCRLLADRGVAVAPFKAQNMSNNARVVARPDATRSVTAAYNSPDGTTRERANDRENHWGEIGVSQFVQARAARITPTTDYNPVLLKPRGNGESQLVLDGQPLEHLPAESYYEECWDGARDAARSAHDRLAREYDVVIAEGAGSIAEINLHDRDLANVETARFADAAILLLVDIERGGAFASLYGTLELLPTDVRERVVGAVITKFRGDRSLLEPGIEEIESHTGVPILGVVPYDDPGLPEEDSVSLPATDERALVGADDVSDERSVTIAVPRLPRISNATDLEVLADEPGVRVAYVPVRGSNASEIARETLASADAVVLPGTKNTVDDLRALRETGFDDAIEAFDGPIVGLCGGYQLLGERLSNVTLEGTNRSLEESSGDEPLEDSERADALERSKSTDALEGLGLLPVETVFEPEKRLERTTVSVAGTGPIAGATGTATGYEIHAGRTHLLEPEESDPLDRPLGPSSLSCGLVLGTYLHGLFDNRNVREAFLDVVARRANVTRPVSDGRDGSTPYDRAARLVGANIALERLGEPFG